MLFFFARLIKNQKSTPKTPPELAGADDIRFGESMS
jgi:hypothetical protein